MFFKNLFGGDSIAFKDASKTDLLKKIKAEIQRAASYDEIIDDLQNSDEIKNNARNNLNTLLGDIAGMICNLLDHPSNKKTKEDWVAFLQADRKAVVGKIKSTYDEIVKAGGSL